MKRLSAILTGLLVLFSACQSNKTEPLALTEGSPAEVFVVTDENHLDVVKTRFESAFNRFSTILLKAEQAEKKEFEPALQFWFGRSESIEGIEKQSPMILVMEIAENKVGKYSSHLGKKEPIKTINGRGYQLYIYLSLIHI